MVHRVRRERGELEERRARIDEPIDAVARGELAAFAMPLDRDRPAAKLHAHEVRAQLIDERRHGGGVALEVAAASFDAGREQAHERTF